MWQYYEKTHQIEYRKASPQISQKVRFGEDFGGPNTSVFKVFWGVGGMTGIGHENAANIRLKWSPHHDWPKKDPWWSLVAPKMILGNPWLHQICPLIAPNGDQGPLRCLIMEAFFAVFHQGLLKLVSDTIRYQSMSLDISTKLFEYFEKDNVKEKLIRMFISKPDLINQLRNL